MEPIERYWAQLGYKAYAKFTGGKTFDGRDMPTWNDLTPRIKEAWTEAAKAIGEDVQAQSVQPL